MRVFFDQNTPRNLARHLDGHEVVRAAQMSWEELKNGDLLKAAEEAAFDLFLTCDRNLEYQQNLANRKIAIVSLSTNNWPLIEPHIQKVKLAVDAASAGSYARVECGVFVKKTRERNG